MPFSDDLYSADANDSDGESMNDELSPADGFFGRDNPLNAMVPDPSQPSDDKTVEDKVLISRPEPRTGSGSSSIPANSPTLEQLLPAHNNASAVSSTYGTSSPTANNTSAPRSFGRIHPDALIMSGLPPPPAYSPSPSSSAPQTLPLPQSPQDSGSYNTFGERRLEHQLEQGYLPTRQPETMGRPEGEPNEATPLAGGQVKRSSHRRTLIRKILFVALVLTVLISILTAVLNTKGSDLVKNPDRDIMPFPKLPGSPGRRYCPSATYHKDPITYYFPLGGDVSVVQKTREEHDGNRGYAQIETTGEIRFRRLPKGSKSVDGKGYTTAVINVSHPDIEVEWTLEDDSRFLTITTPRYARVDSSTRHCVSLDIVVWVPEGAKLTSLLVSAFTLGLTVLDDIQLDVDRSRLESLSGHISFPTPSSADTPNVPISHPEFRFDSRRVEIQTISGDISGLFPLLDYLELGSQSGNIDVSVLPHDALASGPSAAVLNVHTTSGGIDVRLPLLSTTQPKFTPPPRDYITTVYSGSGDISGTYYLGSHGEFKTASGEVKTKILPIVQYGNDPDKDPKADFKTETLSGDINIDILNPMFISLITPEHPTRQISTAYSEERKLRNLQSSHNTTSGDISIRSPAAWEGSVSGQTLSGDISLEGKGLDVIKYKKGYVHKEFLARKGVDSGDVGSTTRLESMSGDLRFVARSN